MKKRNEMSSWDEGKYIFLNICGCSLDQIKNGENNNHINRDNDY